MMNVEIVYDIINIFIMGLELSWSERYVDIVKVSGSNPDSPTRNKSCHAE